MLTGVYHNANSLCQENQAELRQISQYSPLVCHNQLVAGLTPLFPPGCAFLRERHSNHIQLNTTENSREVLYRVPNQSSLDGNTVDEQTEKSAFADNALRYQASITFLDGKLKGMMAAIKGE